MHSNLEKTIGRIKTPMKKVFYLEVVHINETELTREIKWALSNSLQQKDYSNYKGIIAFGYEVPTSKYVNTYVDFAVSSITSKIDNTICYEIKTSVDDFNSKYGMNFYGNQNYYVVPEYMENYVMDKMKDNRLYNSIGLLVYIDKGEHYAFSEIKTPFSFENSETTCNIRDYLFNNSNLIGDIDRDFAIGILKLFNMSHLNNSIVSIVEQLTEQTNQMYG